MEQGVTFLGINNDQMGFKLRTLIRCHSLQYKVLPELNPDDVFIGMIFD